jgi:hypothetical protein
MRIDPAIIEFANDALYVAFNARDLQGMAQLWAAESPTVCIHPGWGPLFGRDEILRSWEEIFSSQPEGANVQCFSPRVLTRGQQYSVVCYEQLPAGWLVATNNFVIEAGAAKIVHHQASQCMNPPELTKPVQTVQ